ncbi:MAG: hypothetical protein GWO16_03185 [Gammaproteobacteria bacterium]|nr:hypothetical protein [Gammaproteobacteria bacterium]NIR97117.1 hypothetical protein [Gammaproteobacteria bacterium]NIT62820.1 hypothetical protein [Gammaproteobacteria bacterium]NIV19785.1 hypothetical protein [Gammaproteobacteria bacterium]NIX11229.1 hypothetical protein [Gammaproteobacteria bacterium]
MPALPRPGPARPRLRWLAAALCLGSTSSAALERLSLRLGTLDGAGWRAEQVEMHVDLQAERTTFDLRAARLELPAPIGVHRNVRMHCTDGSLEPGAIRCRRGTARIMLAILEGRTVPLSFDYRIGERHLALQLHGVALAGGTVDARAEATAQRWHAELDGRGLRGRDLAPALAALGVWPQGYSGTGSVAVHADANGGTGGLARLELRTELRSAGFASPDMMNAAEKLDIVLEGRVSRDGNDWRIAGDLHVAHGTLCADSCWTMPARPVHLSAQVHWRPEAGALEVRRLTVTDPRGVHAGIELTLSLDPPRLDTLTLQLGRSRLGALYQHWLRPTLIEAGLDALEVRGWGSGSVSYGDGRLRALQAHLETVDVEDGEGRAGLTGVNGVLAWDEDGRAPPSTLRWQSGHLYDIAIGASHVAIRTAGHSAHLDAPLAVPVLDGRLELDRLSADWSDAERPRFQLDGVLTPVSMAAFSEAVGWPTMSGKLSGVIPDVRYDGERLEVGGVLLVRAFDGAITVRNLQLERLLGVAPVLRADVDIRSVDLDLLTRTFSFGSIEGRIAGRVHELVLLDWRPVAFDARLATPEDDDSRHRISQRAVENLTSLGGGGMGGALSRTFLSVFERFGYDRLGIRCRLREGVCEMGGVAPAPGGYYIVKGGGLPRIHVIGYENRVDWDVLVTRLKTITSGEGSVVR